jgi:hypothetical protein
LNNLPHETKARIASTLRKVKPTERLHALRAMLKMATRLRQRRAAK